MLEMADVALVTAAVTTACSSASVSTPMPSSEVAATAARTTPSRSAVTPVTPRATKSSTVSAGPPLPAAVDSTCCTRVAMASSSAMESTEEVAAAPIAPLRREMPDAFSEAAVVAPISA